MDYFCCYMSDYFVCVGFEYASLSIYVVISKIRPLRIYYGINVPIDPKPTTNYTTLGLVAKVGYENPEKKRKKLGQFDLPHRM